jgi:hypothetical protein
MLCGLPRLLALVSIAGAVAAALLGAPANASAIDTYEASFNGGHLTATANEALTEATIESVSVNFGECGTAPEEASCTWEAIATLHSHPESRCDPSTPDAQVVWDSGPQSGNGTVSGGPTSFPLEGCRGQTLVFRIEFHKTYEEGGGEAPLRIIGGASEWPMFSFGYPPLEEAEREIIEASPPAQLPPFEPNFAPPAFSVAAGCRSLTIGDVRYAFAFARMGCRKASNLARARLLSGDAPSGYLCRSLRADRGGLCWRRGQPQKYLEWRLPGTKPAHA